jgi:hypothetical protein
MNPFLWAWGGAPGALALGDARRRDARLPWQGSLTRRA